MTNPALIAYVSCMHSREILVFRLDHGTGGLTQIQNVPANGMVMPLALSPDRRYLYAALRSEPYRVSSFSIDASSGKLTHLADAPLPGSMPYISVDRSGRFLFGVSNAPKPPLRPRKSLISVSAIGTEGSVHAPHQVLPTRDKGHAVLPAPSSRHVFVSSCDEDVLLCRRFDAATGMLADDPIVAGVQANAGPRHFIFHPGNQWLYLLNEYDATVYAFKYDADSGELNELQRVSLRAPDAAGKSLRGADLRLTPDARFLYASERNSNTLVVFRLDAATGILARTGSFSTDKEPRGFNIDPQGRYLLAAGRITDCIISSAIDRESGSLTEVARHAAGRGPNWIEMVSLG